MITNALNDVWLDIYILQIIIQQELKKLAKILQENLVLKIENFQSKLKIFTKLKKRIASALVFFVTKTGKKYPIYVSRNTFRRLAYLLLIGEKVKKSYVSIKDFSTYMHCGRKHFCRYCLQSFNTKEILQFYINDCFKINGKQEIKMPKNDEYVRFKKY